MTSGKQSKRLRAAPKPVPVRSTPRKRQASPRVLAIAGAFLALAAAAVVLGVVLTGGDSQDSNVPARGSLTNALPGAVETEQLLRGISQSGNVVGESTAPVTVYYYVDAQCPFCRDFEAETMPTLIERYVRTGKAKIELRPIAFIGPDSERGRAAMIAGAEQNKMFNVTQLLFATQGPENSGWLSDELVERVAASIPGVDVPRLLEDRGASFVDDKSSAFDAEATTHGVNSTPTILVGKSGEKAKLVPLGTGTDTESVAGAIDAALR
ncbi:MAG: DsbA family protein [Gaiellaceae bacterium]